jgi:hypothetical protein
MAQDFDDQLRTGIFEKVNVIAGYDAVEYGITWTRHTSVRTGMTP